MKKYAAERLILLAAMVAAIIMAVTLSACVPDIEGAPTWETPAAISDQVNACNIYVHTTLELGRPEICAGFDGSFPRCDGVGVHKIRTPCVYSRSTMCAGIADCPIRSKYLWVYDWSAMADHWTAGTVGMEECTTEDRYPCVRLGGRTDRYTVAFSTHPE